jgi:hypothetical protein
VVEPQWVFGRAGFFYALLAIRNADLVNDEAETPLRR